MEQFVAQWGPASSLFWVRAVWALAVFVIVLWLANVAQRSTRHALQRARVHANAVLFLEQVARLAGISLGVVIVLAILGVEFSALVAIFGFATVAISLSLQDLLRSLIAGLYLLLERPFEVGDQVMVGTEEGVIENVGMRTTILRRADGNRVIVPNLVLFTSVVTQKNSKENV